MNYSTFPIAALLLLSLPADAPDTRDFHRERYAPQTYTFEKATTKTIELRSFWTTPPDILICDKVVSESRMRKAVKFWERLGYEFGEIIESNDPLNCINDNNNKIRIMLPNSNHDMSNELAITLTDRILATSEAVSADIFIHSFATKKELVLEHEIGHALGWQHINQAGHVMYPEYKLIGHGTSYIDYTRYMKIMYQNFIKE